MHKQSNTAEPYPFWSEKGTQRRYSDTRTAGPDRHLHVFDLLRSVLQMKVHCAYLMDFLFMMVHYEEVTVYKQKHIERNEGKWMSHHKQSPAYMGLRDFADLSIYQQLSKSFHRSKISTFHSSKVELHLFFHSSPRCWKHIFGADISEHISTH